jgi:hypothetical protein
MEKEKPLTLRVSCSGYDIVIKRQEVFGNQDIVQRELLKPQLSMANRKDGKYFVHFDRLFQEAARSREALTAIGYLEIKCFTCCLRLIRFHFRP